MEKKQIMFLLVLVGALIAIIAAFMQWIVIDLGFFGKANISGWEIITGDKKADGVDSGYFVTISFVLAILVLVGALLNVVGMLPEQIGKYSSVLLLLFGIIIAVMAIAFFSSEISGKDLIGAGTGLWMSLVGGILIALPSILALIEK